MTDSTIRENLPCASLPVLPPVSPPSDVAMIVNHAIEELKTMLHAAESNALRKRGEVPAQSSAAIQLGFRNFSQLINEQIGNQSTIPANQKSEIGLRIQRELLPYLLLTYNAERCYSKPRGYSGDFLAISDLYEDRAQGIGRLGALIDRCFLNEPAAAAVRNRRQLMKEEILGLLEARNEPTHVTSLACGPATELFDIFEQLPNPALLAATLVDLDFQALAFVADKRDSRQLKQHMHLVQANLVHVASGKHTLDLAPQDLIYSIGLIDYFADEFVVKLLNRIHEMLRPKGKVILGNFHPNNPTKALMDHVLEWKLIHRNEKDMDRLFSQSFFAKASTRMRFEPQGVNLFAECVK